MIKVLFICLGNICRSPMSEAYMRHIVKKNNLSDKIEISSKATSNYNIGNPPHSGTQNILRKYKIDFSNIYSEQLSKQDLIDSDYIIVMDDSNMKDVLKLKSDKKIYKITDFIDDCEYDHVPDPYYTGNFDLTYELVKNGCDCLLKYIIENHF